MKKPILISGRQGAGKTTLLHRMMSEKIAKSNGLFGIISNECFRKRIEKFPFREFSTLAIDDINRISELRDIYEYSSSFKISFIVTSNINLKDIPEYLLSKFEVITLGNPTTIFNQ